MGFLIFYLYVLGMIITAFGIDMATEANGMDVSRDRWRTWVLACVWPALPLLFVLVHWAGRRDRS